MDLEVKRYDGKIGVAVSGGMDSIALLNAYLSAGQNLAVVNAEHGIRGESSINDSLFVKKYCEENNIPLYFKKLNCPEKIKQGESMETCARRLRYEFFEELISSGKVEKIALAHHANDNAETVLMRIFRGTGIKGLSGITERDNYLRPLLPYTRNEIETYVKEKNLPYVTDETNLSSDYTRNFIRNELLPLIETRYPDVIKSVSRLSENALCADLYLSSVCPKAEKIGNEYHIKSLFGFPEILQRYALMQTVREMGFLQDFENRHVENVLTLSSSPNNTEIDLPFGLVCVKNNDGVIIAEKNKDNNFEAPFSKEKTYSYCGKTYRFETGKTIEIGITLDGDKIPENSVIRTRRDGDKFKRVNGKTKLLSDFLNDKKLTVLQKNQLLVLAKDEQVLAILGLETADAVKVTETTTEILHIITE